MTDIIGPSSSAPNVVTARPADSRVFNALDTWFKACSAPGANDGTTISDGFLNGLLGILRTATRGMGIADSTVADNLLRDAIRAAKIRLAVAGGTPDALTVAFSPPHITYNEAAFFVVPSAANTGAAMTLTLDGLALKAVKFRGGDPPAGLFQAGVAQLLMYDGTNLQVMGGGRIPGLPKLSLITSTQTWVRAAGATNAFTLLTGGGGGGGGGAGTAQLGGGGAGGEIVFDMLDISAVPSALVTIGAGGTAGANSTLAAAGTGGTTTFGALLSALGGLGGRAGGTSGTPISNGEGGIGQLSAGSGNHVRGAPGGAGGPNDGGAGGGGLFGLGGGAGGADISGTGYGQAGMLGSGGGGSDVGKTGSLGGNGASLVAEI
ncbi:hypothetical protein V5F32_00755 [Xanthobacter oligotrophicus]|uniref:Glycine-rich domain-containing protein n=1 Tax=Xanthobacter oligotrophicus TaxID=2607286 RepID=A0ABW6ZPP1_9HYPH